jgi:anhydro-N-acetylmuramic acid kinase
MSGTSLDGVDSVLMSIDDSGIHMLASHHLDFPTDIRNDILALCSDGHNELHRSELMANKIARLYGDSVQQLLSDSQVSAKDIVAIGAHGQTIRHMPPNYTVQIINAARLAEITGITVVKDFRNRDLAAGGQGAPLVPAFHHHLFHSDNQSTVVVNIGGMANISILDKNGSVNGYDTGPGNVLMDAWFSCHLNGAYDEDGNWARCGSVIPELLDAFMEEPYFSQPSPKSTGRELFDMAWLLEFEPHDYEAQDVQATLLELTAQSIAKEISAVSDIDRVIVCGGGAYNGQLMQALADSLPQQSVQTSDELGIDAQAIEALAFGWLAQRCLAGLSGNVPAVTGAKGERVLGAIYPSGNARRET